MNLTFTICIALALSQSVPDECRAILESRQIAVREACGSDPVTSGDSGRIDDWELYCSSPCREALNDWFISAAEECPNAEFSNDGSNSRTISNAFCHVDSESGQRCGQIIVSDGAGSLINGLDFFCTECGIVLFAKSQEAFDDLGLSNVNGDAIPSFQSETCQSQVDSVVEATSMAAPIKTRGFYELLMLFFLLPLLD
eukprot:TRINITY_DN76050_c0_g1_i1.p1 TRINITY_DN76050_c0_g1~~TRINITY_DN76050_c0_g1_i1.p1  ORF type:complete len:198 (+),score=8.08 TRINITY_DN76050_c0_g1_i1:52-645(+)